MSNENENENEDEGDVAVENELVYQETDPRPDKHGCIEVSAKKDGKEAIVFFDFGDDLDEMTGLFGQDVVFTNARGKMKIALQAGMRSYLKANKSVEDLMNIYKPGVALERIPTDMNKATEDYFGGLSEEDQDAMIARLMQKKG